MLKDLLPSEFHLSQNYPNPFSDKTTIKYCVPHNCRVLMTVHNCDGAVVERLVDEIKKPGTYEVVWHAKDLPGGTYECRLKAGNFGQTRKMSFIGANQ
jgi:hypothetical protein